MSPKIGFSLLNGYLIARAGKPDKFEGNCRSGEALPSITLQLLNGDACCRRKRWLWANERGVTDAHV